MADILRRSDHAEDRANTSDRGGGAEHMTVMLRQGALAAPERIRSKTRDSVHCYNVTHHLVASRKALCTESLVFAAIFFWGGAPRRLSWLGVWFTCSLWSAFYGLARSARLDPGACSLNARGALSPTNSTLLISLVSRFCRCKNERQCTPLTCSAA